MNIDSSGAISIRFAGHEHCTPEHSFGPAVRTHYLLHFVLSGQGFFKTQTARYNLKKGECFLIRPGQLTYYQADQNEPWEYAWVAFDGYEVKHLLECTAFHSGSETALVNDFAHAERYIMQIEDLFLNNPQKELLQLSMFYALMDTLCCTQPCSQQPDMEYQYFQKAFHYIAHNFSYPIKISEIANYVGIDRSYLYKLFVKYENCSPKQCLLKFRIESAKNMLSHEQYTITQSAFSSGFTDMAAFCKQFKKSTGITPTVYKEQLQKNI